MAKQQIDEFQDRLAPRREELRTLYRLLYGPDERAWSYFMKMLADCYAQRSEALRSLDRSREQRPDWYSGRDLVGMLMYVDAFAGTLSGVREKLDYIQDCGVNYLHLMPLLESPEGRSDGGYAVSDFRKVQPQLGTMEDLAALAADCHDRGIALCLDFVMNHTSEDHEWAKKARQGDPECQARYFFYDNWDVPFRFEETVPQVFPTTAPGNFSWCQEADKVVMTTFYPYQWDLNYANPIVFNDMTENMLFLCNQGIDIIRLDAVPYIWKELGTSCRNLPQVHTLVRMMRLVCEIVCPGTLLLGEVVMEPSKVVPYFGSVDRPECHLLYNVTTMATTWHTVATHDVRLLEHQLGQVFVLPHEYTFLNYLRCHDDIGWGLDYDYLHFFGMEQIPHKKYLNDYLTGKGWDSDARGELYNDDPRLGDARLCGTTASLCGIETARREGDSYKLEHAVRMDVMLHAYMFTLSGIPVLYSGDELARENDYTYHDDPLKAQDSRYLHRGRMLWENAGKRTDPNTVEGRVFTALRRLEELRAEHRVFDGAADVWIVPTGDWGVLGIGRYCRGEKMVALFNFSDGARTISFSELGDFADAFTGEPRDKTGITLASGDFAWLLCDFGMTDGSESRRTETAAGPAAKENETDAPAAETDAEAAGADPGSAETEENKKKEKSKKLIFLDIDGTLTVAGTNVPPKSALKAIRAAQAAGHKVVLCTGRNWDMMSPLMKYGFDGAVASGGGYVVCDGKVLFDCPMTETQRQTALALMKEAGVFCTIEAKDGTFGDEGMAEFLGTVSGGNSELVRWRRAIEDSLNIRPMAEYDDRPIYKIVFMCRSKEQLSDACLALSKDFQFLIQDALTPGCVNGELVNRKFNKGSGVRRMAEAFGVPIEDTIGFGDSMNDLEMVQAVGYSVCMANGSPALQKISDMVCPAVEEDGLAKAFESLGLTGDEEE